MENLSKGLMDTEAAKILGLSPQTLRNMRSKGKGPVYYKIGRAVRYLPDDIIKFREQRRIQTQDMILND